MYSFSNSFNTKTAVFGDGILEHYIFGICNRISTVAYVQAAEFKSESFTLGGVGKVLENFTGMGCPRYLIYISKQIVKLLLYQDLGQLFIHMIKAVQIKYLAKRLMFAAVAAGDTLVVTVLSFAAANGIAINDACEFTNHAATVVVAKAGNVIATLNDINKYR